MLSDAAVGMHRGLNVEELAIVAQKVTGRCAANTQRLFQDRFEHRGEVARRGVDHSQHFGGGGLLLQCFARLGQQPCIFHRDDGLSGKVLQQRDLLVGERTYLLAVDEN